MWRAQPCGDHACDNDGEEGRRAGDAGRLRKLRDPASGRRSRADLQLRVHVLRAVRRLDARRVPKLRRRAGRSPAPSTLMARRTSVPGLSPRWPKTFPAGGSTPMTKDLAPSLTSAKPSTTRGDSKHQRADRPVRMLPDRGRYGERRSGSYGARVLAVVMSVRTARVKRRFGVADGGQGSGIRRERG